MSWANSSDDISKTRNSYNIQPLKGAEDYEIWSIRVHALLAGNGLASYVTIPNHGMEAVIEGQQPVLLSNEGQKAKSIILLNLTDGPLIQIRHIQHPYDIWEALRNLYASKGFSNDFYLCKEFFNTTLESCEGKMEAYINKIKRISDQLYAKNIQLPDKVIFAWAIGNLTEEYEGFVTTITQTMRVNGDKALNLAQLFANLVDESKRITIRDNESVLYVQKNNKPNKLGKYRVEKTQKKCPFCKKGNHKAEKCWFKHPELRPKPKEDKTPVITEEEIAMPVIKTSTSIDEELDFDVAEYNDLAYSTPNANCEFAYHIEINRLRFILDSGATIHICCEKSYFREIKPCNSTVSWGKISRIKASGIGSVPIIFSDTGQKAILQNCLYVPEFQINLISVHKLLKNYKVIFDNYCHIYTKDSQKLMSRVTACDKLFVLSVISNLKEIANTAIEESNAEKALKIHRQMGHIGVTALNKTLSKNMIKIDSITCQECILAKATKHINHDFKHEKRDLQYLELVRSDLFGPVQVLSFGKKRYFITFLDEAYKWLEVELLSQKSDAKMAFCKYYKQEERQSGRKLKIFRTDNGTEFFDITKVCIENGIHHQKTGVYAHEQAAGGERINLTLLNKIRAMLFLAKLDKRFWAEALLAAVYLYNRTPHTSVNYKSPYELKFGHKPNLKHIKIWGSLAYSLINKPKKLDPRAKPTILIGYEASNLYKLLDVTNGKTFLSRDVQILEGVFLDEIQKTPNNFLIDEINASRLVDKREKYRVLPLSDAQKNSKRIFSNAAVNKDVTSKISNETNKNSLSNDLILSNLNDDNIQNAQKLIPEDEENFSRSRDDNSLVENFTPDSNFDELGESDHVISRNPSFETSISPTDAQIAQLQNLQNLHENLPNIDDFSEDELALIAENINSDPVTYHEAKASPDSAEWIAAMDKEINDLQIQNTWKLVKPPPNAHILDSRWVFKTKLNKDSSINKRKARFVAKGFQQKYGIDFLETYSNTVKPMVYRMLFAFIAHNNCELKQWDIKSAFPNAELESDLRIYVKQPKGYEKGENLVCLLRTALYGLKQAARQFYIFLRDLLANFGYEPIIGDISVFFNKNTGIIVAAHIDDLLIAGSDINKINELQKQLQTKVEISDLGDADFFLGMEITRNREKHELFLTQKKYTSEILARFNITGEKPIYSPTVQGVRLEKNSEQASATSIKRYQQEIGSLMYLMTSTRPDLAFPVGNCARFMSNPSAEHFKAAERIWQYVRTTRNRGIKYHTSFKLDLIGYVDSDWGGDYTTRNSTTGYLVLLGQSPISWSSKLQKRPAASSCEAEYMALKNAVQEMLWLQSVIKQLSILGIEQAKLLYCDNMSAIALSKNLEHHARIKHIDVQFHFVRHYIEQKIIDLKYIFTKKQLVDAFTKTIVINTFKSFCKKINLIDL